MPTKAQVSTEGLRCCDCRFEKIFEAYRKKKSLAENAVRFMLDGVVVKGHQSPGEMGAENGDIIDAGAPT